MSARFAPLMLTRFELAVIVEVQVSDRDLLRHYRAVEAAAEGLAPLLGVAPDRAAMAGLGAGIDAQLCRANPARRGIMAREMLLTEGADPELAEALASARRDPAEQLSPLAQIVVLAEALVGAMRDEAAFATPGAQAVRARVEFAARRDPASVAARAVDAAARHKLDLGELTRRVLEAVPGATQPTR